MSACGAIMSHYVAPRLLRLVGSTFLQFTRIQDREERTFQFHDRFLLQPTDPVELSRG
jgi:hypothetical protein